MNIRKFVLSLNTLDELVGIAWITEQAARSLEASVGAGLNILVAGGTQTGKTIGQLAHPTRAGTDAILARRGRVLDAVLDWITTTATPSASSTGATYDLMAWARVGVAALQPFLSPTVEAFTTGFSGGNEVVTFDTSVLPDDPRLANTIDAAAAGIRDVLLRTDFTPANGPGVTLIRQLIDLPHDLRATSRRGLPSASGPLPMHATGLLERAAATIEGGVAARWAELPLIARHHAARQSVRRRGAMGAYRSLAQRAAAGDVVAKLAVRDDELAPALVLVPVDVNDHDCGNAAWTRSEQRRRRAAEALAATTLWADGIDLLQSTALLEEDGVCTPPRSFARQLTSDLAAASADALLTTLASRHALPYEAELIRPLFAARPAEVLAALKRSATSIRGGELLPRVFQDVDDAEKTEIVGLLLGLIHLPVAGEPGTGTHKRLRSNQPAIAATVQRLAAGLTGRTAPMLDVASRGLRRLARRAAAMPSRVNTLMPRMPLHRTTSSRDDQDLRLSEPGAEATDEVQRSLLAEAFAAEVFRSPWPGRVDALIDIGLLSAPAVLTQVLRYLAANEGNQARWPPLTNEQWSRALALVERRFDQVPEHRALLGDDCEVGRMIRALALKVPAELAGVVADRLTRPEAARLRRPSAWRSYFVDTTVDQRTPFALALTRELTVLERLLEAHHQFDLDQSVAAICAGTAGWEVALLGLAAGPEADNESGRQCRTVMARTRVGARRLRPPPVRLDLRPDRNPDQRNRHDLVWERRRAAHPETQDRSGNPPARR